MYPLKGDVDDILTSLWNMRADAFDMSGTYQVALAHLRESLKNIRDTEPDNEMGRDWNSNWYRGHASDALEFVDNLFRAAALTRIATEKQDEQ